MLQPQILHMLQLIVMQVLSQSLLIQGHDIHISGNDISISASDSLEISSDHDIRFAVKNEEVRNSKAYGSTSHLIFNFQASFDIKSYNVVLSRLTTGTPAPDLSDNGMAGHQLCICGNSGRVFRVPGHCAAANEHVNPCL